MIEGIAFSAYPVKDMKRARAFYENDLGLKVSKDYGGGNFIEYHLQGNCFTLIDMGPDGPEPDANKGGSVTFEVDDMDALLTQLRAKQIQIKMEPMQFPNCRMAIIVDTEGNALGLHTKKTA